jgi:hypothetical protein
MKISFQSLTNRGGNVVASIQKFRFMNISLYVYRLPKKNPSGIIEHLGADRPKGDTCIRMELTAL